MSACKGCSNFLRSKRFQGCIGMIQMVGDDKYYAQCGFGYNKHAIQNVRFISINCDEVKTKKITKIAYQFIVMWLKIGERYPYL